MKLDKISIDGKKDSIEVLDKIFSAKVNNKLVSSVLYKTNANYKGRHAKTKQQNEVRGPTSKIYAQKGTGGARHASRKAPIFVGGGIAHGPKGELPNRSPNLGAKSKIVGLKSSTKPCPCQGFLKTAATETNRTGTLAFFPPSMKVLSTKFCKFS